jgi:Tfp pilus assembly protein PilF
VLYIQGDLAAAQRLFERALTIDERVYGSDHPEVATDLNNLGTTLMAQGDTDAARSLLKRALLIQERMLGPEHPTTEMVRKNLAALDQ